MRKAELSSFISRYQSLIHYLLASLPLLIILGTIRMNFGSEAEVIVWFKTHAAAHPDLKSAAKIITNWGNIAFYPVYLWFLISGIRRRRENKSRLRFALVFLIVQLAVSLLLVRIMKMSIGKPRPGKDLSSTPSPQKRATTPCRRGTRLKYMEPRCLWYSDTDISF